MPPGTKGDPSNVTQPLPCLPSAEEDAIKVFVRIRPPVEGTLTGVDGEQGLCLTALSSTTIRLHSKPEPKMFTFDHVANVDTNQESVFSSVAKNIVESCMNGYNGTIFAYGQTGSGKTFTMLGPSESDNFTHNLRGVIPRSFEYLFFLINREKEKAGEGKSFLCKCSFIEIYNEQIFDLLDSASAGLFLREHIKKGVFVVGAVEQVVTSAAEAYQVLSMGWRNRRVASTSMNRESSRSHAVFTVTIESMEKTNDLVNIRSSQLNLVDLAGSERQKDTQTEGVRLKEAGSINRSLSCLGQVITALVDVANGRQRHICYRDSKLTFLLRDSLGGNAKTFYIANVHPGSKCFGETLSTLQFAQRAKLIKNKAVVNEDTQGNVSQLQAEVKKLKEQLSQLLSGQMPGDISVARVPSVGDNNMDYMNNFIEAMMILEKSDREKKVLLQKVVQLEDLCNKKEKFIQSNKMIVKFREDHISRLEKAHKEGRISLSNNEQDDFIAELKEEIRTLKEQVEHHPRVAKYALENHSLREENKRLHSLQSVKRAQEVTAQMIAELEKAFLEVSVSEKDRQVAPMHSTPIQLDNNSLMSAARMRERMLQLESELATSKQEYEEFKELTKKKQVEQESELQSLIKSNQHLENILEAIKANKRHEVSQLNRMHAAETIKNMTTPTKSYNLRSRLVPRLSPDAMPNGLMDTPKSGDVMDDIINEPIPPEMSEQAYEAIAEELRIVQEQVTALQAKLDEEEGKNIRLQQQVNKLELCSTQIQELFNSERSNWNKEQQDLIAQIKSLEKQKQENKSQEDVLKSEVHDLRVVLQSADRELGAVKGEYSLYREKQEKELSQLSARHMDVQLQLDNVRLEHETLLEEKRSLQDAFDNLEEVMKFEIDQLKQEISDSKHENETLRAEFSNLLELLETEKERRQKLTSQLEEDKENKTKELLQVVDENMHLRKQCSELMTKCEQQVTELHGLEHSLTSSKEMIADLEKKNTADKEVVADLMNQIQVHRTTIIHKTESIDLLTRELEDIHSKYSIVLLAKEESKTVIEEQEKQIEELRECLERKQSADNIEKELLCDDLAHATEELEKLTEAFNKQEALLHTHEKELVEKEQQISELTNQVKLMTDLEISREQEKIRPASSNSSSPVVLPETPRTPEGNPYDSEIANLQKRNTNLEILVSELNEERTSKNEEIIRLKMQLCETENMRLEIQNLQGMCKELKSQLENCNNVMKDSNDQKPSDMQDLKREIEKEVSERMEKGKATEHILKLQAELEETRNILCTKDHSLNELSKEIERTRSLEAKAFTEKEEIRSILEGKYEETEKLSHELDMLRKQVLFLAEENGKILGHQNPNQKIQYLVKLKKENNKLLEEAEKLRIENLFLKESKKCEHCN
ncbi:kinesin-like protein KIF15-A [Xenopus laevis]|uniref:Kinesin-like protein KIF15-A n=1 Tax=Xenopus laevis TaxID=8355 RepID=KI15A_XENLA|nr:kinesin-like protein KIF15-A [Xenopus laevis]Q91785.1 RecName: Full=Kinesin-like protein KIF15-A; AltName: Full=Kinesin-like protein 2-A; Short=Xklp2-A [Xenopus laevis]CAA63826.1 KLP2 protein [Xenopus laevis]prf//2206309A kinesin-like protein [Xenopus laevis]